MKEKYNYILSKDNKIYYYDYDFSLNKSQIKSVDINNLNQSGIIYIYNKCKDIKTTLV